MSETFEQIHARIKARTDGERLRVLADDCPRCELSNSVQLLCRAQRRDFCKLKVALEAEAAEVLRFRQLEKNCRMASVPPALIESILGADLDPEITALKTTRRFVSSSRARILVLSGTPGNGKSTAACEAVAVESGVCILASKLNLYSDESDQLIAAGERAQLLVLNEVGTGESRRPVAAERIEHLCLMRFDADLQTIITTNLVDDDFWSLYGGDAGPLADRVAGDPFGWVRCMEKSLRGRERTKGEPR